MTTVAPTPVTMASPTGDLPRLLPRTGGSSLVDHLDRWGDLVAPADLVAEVGRAGLRGRGGAGFPTAVKMAAVRQAASGRRRPVVVANGTEGEPISSKDRVLMERNPHLVLDGVVASARALGADRAVVCVSQGSLGALASMREAVVSRRGSDPLLVEVVLTPDRYLTGEETALVNWLNSGRPLPTLSPPRPAERGVGHRPTLVDNVETMANVGLIARFGGSWWRRIGSTEDPGSMLLTLSGAVERPGVYEVELGAGLGRVLSSAGVGPIAGVLIGGYFGSWLSPETARQVSLDRASLSGFGASLGCGAVVALPAACCPLAETARVTHWLAGQSAGQCGPCVNGLPSIAAGLDAMVEGDPTGHARSMVERWSGMVRGRGACKMPDGTVRFVGSALEVFADHVGVHRAGRCPGLDHPAVLPTPREDRRRS